MSKIKTINKTLLLVSLVILSAAVNAMSGFDLNKYCREYGEGGINAGACFGYSAGVVHASNGKHCVPENARNGNLGLVVFWYLRDHPTRLHRPASSLVLEAIRESYPCEG